MAYVPIVAVSTVPVLVAAKLPSTTSSATAPSSVYTPPTTILIVLLPVTVMTGASTSGVMTSTTFTVRVAVPIFKAASVEE